jgi:Rap1a immunity proteins
VGDEARPRVAQTIRLYNVSPPSTAQPRTGSSRVLNWHIWAWRVVWIVFASLPLFSAPAHSLESADELLSSCERFLQVARITEASVTITGDDVQAHQCWAYLNAFQQLSAIRNASEMPTKRTITRACPPEESELVQLIRVFVAYAQKHPEDLHQRAAYVTLDALRAAFPCPTR